MQYICLIYNAEDNGPQPGTDEFGPYMQAYVDYTQEVQDAVLSALEVWPVKGAPRHPDAWMISVAKRKALDRLRRSATATRKEAELTLWLEQHQSDPEDAPMLITDHRLELIFTCCHPALEEKSRVALTLRALGGLTTAEIAKAFLDKPDAMAARLTRAKKKLAGAGIPFKLPEPEDLHDRTDAVLRVIYLVFNEGYQASDGQLTRGDLVAAPTFWPALAATETQPLAIAPPSPCPTRPRRQRSLKAAFTH